ncbi:DUF397 domain-containing protein [Actinoallomurus rhizosphaericola]
MSQSNEISIWHKSSHSQGGTGDCVEVTVVESQRA